MRGLARKPADERAFVAVPFGERNMNASRFFESAIPYFICQSLEAFMASKGIIHFSIDGQGSWTVALGNIEEPITRGLVGKPDLVVWYSDAAFAAFLDGTMDARAVIKSGDFSARGDVQLLEKLGRLLLPNRAPIGIRVGLA